MISDNVSIITTRGYQANDFSKVLSIETNQLADITRRQKQLLCWTGVILNSPFLNSASFLFSYKMKNANSAWKASPPCERRRGRAIG